MWERFFKTYFFICVITATWPQHKGGGALQTIFSLFFSSSERPKTSPRFLKQNYIFPEAGQTRPAGMSRLQPLRTAIEAEAIEAEAGGGGLSVNDSN